MCRISVVLTRHENDTKTTRLIKRVTRVIFGLSGLTRNPPVYYTCYTCQPEIDTKIKWVIQTRLFCVVFESYRRVV